jgi:TolB-like protein/DNA-binding winged helix-turn-helix (wHTH) protein
MQPAPNNSIAPRQFRLADLEVDVGKVEVTRGGEKIALPKLSFDLLCALINAAPAVVTNDELLAQVWPGLMVSPESVAQRVKLLRSAIGDDSQEPRYILGVRGRGYRLIPAVERLTESTLPRSDATKSSINTSGAIPGGPTSQTQTLERSNRRRVVIGAAVIIGVSAAIALGVHFWGAKRGVQVPTAVSRGTAEPAVAAFNPPPHSIAVLPFVNISGDKEQQYFSDGLTEELLNSLSRINELQVAARTSSFSFQGEHPDISTVAHKLNVGAVLEGSVRRSAHTVRVTAQLVNGVTGFHLWSQTYDRNLSDVLALQTEIANAVASALQVALIGNLAEKIELGGTRDPAAFDAYLRGSKALTNEHGAKDAQIAIAAYSEAIRLDPHYARAFVARSWAFDRLGGVYETDYSIALEELEKAHADARKATELAPELGEGHLALAEAYTLMLDLTRASQEYERAVALAPGNAGVLLGYGSFAVLMGRTDAGVAAARRGVLLDPLNRHSYSSLGQTLLYARHYEEAVAPFGRPGFSTPTITTPIAGMPTTNLETTRTLAHFAKSNPTTGPVTYVWQ